MFELVDCYRLAYVEDFYVCDWHGGELYVNAHGV
jgi:hypothetical protein